MNVRKKGCVIPHEKAGFFCYVRSLSKKAIIILLIKILLIKLIIYIIYPGIRVNNWVNTTYLLNMSSHKTSKEVNIENVDIPKFKEQMVKLE